MQKNILLNSEITEIVLNDVAPAPRLFQFTTTISREWNFLQNLLDLPSPGQQDSLDFFTCLEKYKEDRFDVSNLQIFNTIQYSVCLSCNDKSRSLQPTTQCLLKLGTPIAGKTVSEMLTEFFREFEVMNNWSDEDGCNQITEAHH